MEQSVIQEAADRIRQMERHFDVLQNAADPNPAVIRQNPALREALRVLVEYYESGQWLADYELDEQGLLPQNLKRGVLSQDAVYDFLGRIRPVD